MKRSLHFRILIVFLICISCSHRKENVITKFIFFNGSGISFDSLEHPQLEILKYLKYSPDRKVKIAKGKSFYEYPNFRVAPAFSLTEFYESQNSDSLESIINKALIGKIYDSSYNIKMAEGNAYNFFIYETSIGEKKEILYYKGALPKELDSLDRFINRLFKTQKLIKTKRYDVNPQVIELYERLSKKNPIPPLPPNIKVIH